MTISNISLEHYLILAALIFSIGVTGLFMNRKSVITILMSIELMLLAVNINFVAFSVYLQDIVGQVFSLIILSLGGNDGAASARNFKCREKILLG